MAKRRTDEEEFEEITTPSSHNIQNAPPQPQWLSFDHFWNSCVKNGTPLLKESCKAHIKALGWMNKPNKWVDGAQHFGIEMEKEKRKRK